MFFIGPLRLIWAVHRLPKSCESLYCPILVTEFYTQSCKTQTTKELLFPIYPKMRTVPVMQEHNNTYNVIR